MKDEVAERAERVLKESKGLIKDLGDYSLKGLFAAHGLDYDKVRNDTDKFMEKITPEQRLKVEKHMDDLRTAQRIAIENATAAARREGIGSGRGGIRTFA